MCAKEYSRRDLRQLSGVGVNQHKAVRVMLQRVPSMATPLVVNGEKVGRRRYGARRWAMNEIFPQKNNAFDDPGGGQWHSWRDAQRKGSSEGKYLGRATVRNFGVYLWYDIGSARSSRQCATSFS